MTTLGTAFGHPRYLIASLICFCLVGSAFATVPVKSVACCAPPDRAQVVAGALFDEISMRLPDELRKPAGTRYTTKQSLEQSMFEAQYRKGAIAWAVSCTRSEKSTADAPLLCIDSKVIERPALFKRIHSELDQPCDRFTSLKEPNYGDAATPLAKLEKAEMHAAFVRRSTNIRNIRTYFGCDSATKPRRLVVINLVKNLDNVYRHSSRRKQADLAQRNTVDRDITLVNEAQSRVATSLRAPVAVVATTGGGKKN